METLRIVLLIGIFLFQILNKHTTKSQGDEISDRARLIILETTNNNLQERVARMEALIKSIMKTNNDTLERVANLESSTATTVTPTNIQSRAVLQRNGICSEYKCFKWLDVELFGRNWCYTRRPEKAGVVSCSNNSMGRSVECNNNWECN